MNLSLGLTLAGRTRRGPAPSPLHPLIAAMGGASWSGFSNGFVADFGDQSLLFQDTGGTVPVTAPGQHVNSILDATGSVLAVNDGADGGFVYRHDGAAGYLEADGTGEFHVAGGTMAGNSVNAVVAYEKTSLVTAHPSRYSFLFRSDDGKIAWYFDRRNDSSSSNEYLSSVRTGGTNNRPVVVGTDALHPVGTKMVACAQASLSEQSIRANAKVKQSEAESGTALEGVSAGFVMLRDIPGNIYGLGAFGGVLGYRDLVALEEYFFATLDIMQDRVPLIAHKGMQTCNAGNTLTAFAYAADLGILRWEADIRISGDGTWHLFHDSSVDNLTNGTGAFNTLTDAYIAGLSVEGSGDPPPTLAAFLALADARGVERIFMEIKNTETLADIQSLVTQIDAAGWLGKVNLSSYILDNVANIRSASSEVEIGYLSNSSGDWSTHLALAKANAPSAMIWAQNAFTDRSAQIAEAHDTGGGAARVGVYLWSVASVDQAIDAAPDGADGVIVDFPVYGYRHDTCIPAATVE